MSKVCVVLADIERSTVLVRIGIPTFAEISMNVGGTEALIRELQDAVDAVRRKHSPPASPIAEGG